MIITINVIENENVIWITTDDDPIGSEYEYGNEKFEEAVSKYLKEYIHGSWEEL